MNRSEIYPRLWQGAQPAEPNDIKGTFDAVVFSWEESEHEWERFRGQLDVCCAPMRDDQHTLREGDTDVAAEAARFVSTQLYMRRRVLVTCGQGLNRSGMITALALRHMHGWTGEEAMRFVRERRMGALYNPAFAHFLESLR